MGAHLLRGSKAGNSWLRRETLGESEFSLAIKLRTKTYPTREEVNRGRAGSVKSRRCGFLTETLGHISGHCGFVKRSRTKRHNKLSTAISGAAKARGWAVVTEPRFRVGERYLMPDLIFVKDEMAVVGWFVV